MNDTFLFGYVMCFIVVPCWMITLRSALVLVFEAALGVLWNWLQLVVKIGGMAVVGYGRLLAVAAPAAADVSVLRRWLG